MVNLRSSAGLNNDLSNKAGASDIVYSRQVPKSNQSSQLATLNARLKSLVFGVDTVGDSKASLSALLDSSANILLKMKDCKTLPTKQLLDLVNNLQVLYKANIKHLQIHHVTQITEQLKLLKARIQEARYQDYLREVDQLNIFKRKLKNTYKEMDIAHRNRMIAYIVGKEKSILSLEQ